jgi:DNA-binding response OmpR family regulator
MSGNVDARSSVTTHRVLVVEDDDNIASALEFAVVRAGLVHDRIASGGSALARIRATRPHLVLLDVMLPQVSGYDICKSVRQDPELQSIRIILMTARGSAEERKRGLALGADGFVSKPFDLKSLIAEVKRQLSDQAG